MRVETILDTIGRTPTVRIHRLFAGVEAKPGSAPGAADAEVWFKLERANPGGSIKDRIALSMIDDAESRGILKPGTTIIEPTSGNTGVGLAMVAAVRGYKLILVMPESMSLERRSIMRAHGAELVLTPRELGMKGAITRAQELIEERSPAWMPMQFDNQANVEVHRRTTAKEILDDFPEGLDTLITGVGTGGHITACGQVLKAKWPKLKVFAVEPVKSPVLSGGTHTPHAIQGIGAGFVPSILDRSVLDGIVQVNDDDAKEYARRAAREEGIFIGISSGAALAAIAQTLPKLPSKSRVLGFCYDSGERYLSVNGLFPQG